MTLRWLLPIRRVLPAALCVALGVALCASGCGSNATEVEGCKSIEEARCRKAPACNINLDTPPHSGSSDDDKIEGCILWYDDACLHGLVAIDPGPAAIQSCVDAINGGDCNTVAHPETNDACIWLVPPDQRPQIDAGSDAK